MNLPNIKTSEIITFNTIALKGAVRDVCRALYKTDDEDKKYLTIADEISNMVDTDEEGARKKYPEVFKYVDIINGTVVSIGSHPSGVLVSDREIEADVGLCSISTSDYPVSMLDMHPLDDLMYVKLDILGLDNIGVINEACKLIGIDRLDPDNTDMNDEKVWKSIRDDTTLIFQWESNSAQSYLKKFMSDETIEKVRSKMPNFSYLKWFSFGNGLLRPACASYRDSVSGGDFYDNGFKELNEFLAPEAGRVCMQETIMMFLVKFCGYSQAESDSVRRAIAKKKGTATLLPEIEQRFIDYSSTHYDITAEKCAEVIKPFLQIILDASSYGFSWNHSDAYSAIGYISGYLRYYYPLEFLTAAFNTFIGDEEKTTAITEYARKVGVKISNVKFRHSRARYLCDKETNTIYKGMQAIKFLNEEVSEKLYEMRNDKFNSFVDVINAFPGNTKQLEILVKLDYFSEFGEIGYLLNVIEAHDKYYGKKQFKKDKINFPEPVMEILLRYANETPKQYTLKDSAAFFNEMSKLIKGRSIPIVDRLRWEEEFLGYMSTTMPDKKGVYVVTKIDTKFSPKISLYSLWSGETTIAKISKRDYQQNPMIIGDTIRTSIEMRPKSRLVNGEWVKDPVEKEPWLKYWANVNI